MDNNFHIFCEVLLTVHLSIFISVINQLDEQNLLCEFADFCTPTCGRPVYGTATCRCDVTKGVYCNFDLLMKSAWCPKHVEA
jgi:hypothetical protein